MVKRTAVALESGTSFPGNVSTGTMAGSGQLSVRSQYGLAAQMAAESEIAHSEAMEVQVSIH